ncbi:MAG: alpha-amylase family glycosyl hydrolase [Chloroflexi bacterium]|nr:alpha-amylase family glycosyl hydrolase [Chloroflexota bacterium]
MEADKIGINIQKTFPVKAQEKPAVKCGDGATDELTAPIGEKVDLSRAAVKRAKTKFEIRRKTASASADTAKPSETAIASKPLPSSRSITMSEPPKTITMIDGEGRRDAVRSDYRFIGDGYDSSRDIVGMAFKEGRESEPYNFKIQLSHLKEEASAGHLDAYLLIGWGKDGTTSLPDNLKGKSIHPWKLAVGAYDQGYNRLIDDKNTTVENGIKSLKFDALTDSVEFEVDKDALRVKGWKDGDPLYLMPFTAKDYSGEITDDLSAPADKPWKTDGTVSGLMRTDVVSPLQKQRDDDWRDDIIYFVMTDRFNNGDKTNDFGADPSNLNKYHGGDIKGLTEKLDYIKDLGATAIWLTPVMDNQTEFLTTEGYHGYWPTDFYKVDEHLGEIKDFKNFVDKAHEKGMKVILDMPLNHVAWEHPWVKDPSKQDWLHHDGDIKDWNNPWQVEHGSLFGLPDLAQENPEVSKHLIDMSKWWIQNTGVDGLRLDAVKHIPHAFWHQYTTEIKEFAGPDFLIVGEDMHGDTYHVQSYQKDGMQSLFDFPLYFSAADTFARDGSMRSLARKMEETNRLYDNPSLMASLIDNHDMSRFLTQAGPNGKEKLKLALAFMMTINRIPSVYYGTEVGMEGEHDISKPPENRKDMEWNKDPELLSYFKNLTSIRSEHPALSKGEFLEMWQDDQLYAYSRKSPEEEAIVVLNNSYDTASREIPLRAESGLKDGTVMKDLLTGEKVTIAGGKIKVEMGSKQPRVFVPAGE